MASRFRFRLNDADLGLDEPKWAHAYRIRKKDSKMGEAFMDQRLEEHF